MQIKPTAIVLGGTFPHKTLVVKLQQRGYYTILIDYHENPPAKAVADEHIRESTMDKEIVLKIAWKRNAKLVISTCIDQANITACFVAEKLGLHVPYSYEIALNVTNKKLMKEIMIKNDIPTTTFYTVNSMDQFKRDLLKFPIIIKPVESNSSKGVKRIDHFNDIQKYLNDAIELSRNKTAIIEEYFEGTEIGIDCFVSNNEAKILIIKERRKIQIKDDPFQQIYGCIWPADIPEVLNKKIQKVANIIAKTFRLNNTPLMIQAVVNKNDLNVIEFAPRIGGGESFRIIKLSTGFDFIDAAIDSFIGKNVDVSKSISEYYFAENFLYSKPGFFEKISVIDTLLKNGTIEYIDSLKTKGMKIGNELSSNNRIGVFVVKSKTKDGLYEKIKLALNKIEAYDIYGNPLLRKDIYEL